jgi:hypothetical protein
MAKKVEAVGAAGGTGDKGMASAIEEAMSKAITEAQAAGVTDPDKLRALMLAARKAVVGPK